MALRFRGLDAPIEVVYHKSSGSPPQPTDPYAQAQAQLGLSTGTAAYNAAMNRPQFQGNPLGGTGWSVTGTDPRTGAPIYSQETSLAPQFQSTLNKPIDTSGLAGMPGGPSTTQDLQTTRDALYKQQMQYLQPEQQLKSEQLKSQLANEGATPGSPAYNTEMDRLAREQEFARSGAATSAITGGGQEQSRLFGLGTQGLQNQLATRNAPISEFEALMGNSPASANALTPDISGAFNQQYQGRLAGYNADVASQNANTQSGAALLSTYLMYLAMAA